MFELYFSEWVFFVSRFGPIRLRVSGSAASATAELIPAYGLRCLLLPVLRFRSIFVSLSRCRWLALMGISRELFRLPAPWKAEGLEVVASTLA
jgi:hypothetical protein